MFCIINDGLNECKESDCYLFNVEECDWLMVRGQLELGTYIRSFDGAS